MKHKLKCVNHVKHNTELVLCSLWLMFYSWIRSFFLCLSFHFLSRICIHKIIVENDEQIAHRSNMLFLHYGLDFAFFEFNWNFLQVNFCWSAFKKRLFGHKFRNVWIKSYVSFIYLMRVSLCYWTLYHPNSFLSAFESSF